MQNSSGVVDSNLAIFTIIDSDLSKLATRVWTHLLSSTVNIFAPGLWAYETTSVIRKLYTFGKITEDEAYTPDPPGNPGWMAIFDCKTALLMLSYCII